MTHEQDKFLERVFTFLLVLVIVAFSYKNIILVAVELSGFLLWLIGYELEYEIILAG